MANADSKMDEMINQPTFDQDAYDKALREHTIFLNNYKSSQSVPNLQSSTSQPTPPPPPSPHQPQPQNNTGGVRGKILNTIKKGHRREASALLDYIDEAQGIEYGPNNSITIQGENITGSNIANMITWLVGEKSKNIPPIPGLGKFVGKLKEIGVPQNIARKTDRQNALRSGVIDPTHDPLSLSNPKTPRRRIEFEEDSPYFTPAINRATRGQSATRVRGSGSKRRNPRQQAYRGFRNWVM